MKVDARQNKNMFNAPILPRKKQKLHFIIKTGQKFGCRSPWKHM